MAALTKGLDGQEMTEIGLLQGGRRGRLHRRREERHQRRRCMRRALTYARDFDALIVHHTEDPDLVGDGVMNEGEFATRLGLLGIPRAAETIMLERDLRLVALDRRPLSRRVDHLRGIARRAAPRQGRRARGHRRGLDQPSHAERERHRRLPHLLQGLAAAARARTTAWRWSRRWPTA